MAYTLGNKCAKTVLNGQSTYRRRCSHMFFETQCRTLWLPDSEKVLRMCLATSTQYRQHVTDGQTVRHFATA